MTLPNNKNVLYNIFMNDTMNLALHDILAVLIVYPDECRVVRGNDTSALSWKLAKEHIDEILARYQSAEKETK